MIKLVCPKRRYMIIILLGPTSRKKERKKEKLIGRRTLVLVLGYNTYVRHLIARLLLPYRGQYRSAGIFLILPMKMEQTECSKTSAYKIQTPGNYPEENIQRLLGYSYLFQRNLLTLRLLMSYIYIYIYIYIYGAPILDVSRSHTTTHHSR